MWQPLSNLIPKSLQKSGIEKQVDDTLVCEEFNKLAKHILGEASQSCRAVYLKNRELVVAVLSSSISSELKFYEIDILKSLEEKFGVNKVKKIRYIS